MKKIKEGRMKKSYLFVLFVFGLAGVSSSAQADTCGRSKIMQEILIKIIKKPCAQIDKNNLEQIKKISDRDFPLNPGSWEAGFGDFQPGDFSGLTQLEALAFRRTTPGLITLPSSPFAGLSNLKQLKLDGITLPLEAFAGLLRLETLRLDRSRGTLPPRLLHGLSNLRHLYFHTIHEIPLSEDLLEDLDQLETLEIDDQSLTLPPKFLKSQAKLKELELKGRYTSLPRDLLATQIKLKSFTVSQQDWGQRNRLETIPPGFFHNTLSLEYLELGRASLLELPLGLFTVRLPLKSLSLSYLSKPPPSDLLINLPDLLVLYLKAVKMTKIEPGFFRSNRNLIRLDLSFNDIERLEDDSFLGLHHLTELDLEYNQLSVVNPAAFTRLPYLKKLNLNGNPRGQ